jgi:hypothetical protein
VPVLGVTPQNSNFFNVTKIHWILKLFLNRLKFCLQIIKANPFIRKIYYFLNYIFDCCIMLHAFLLIYLCALVLNLSRDCLSLVWIQFEINSAEIEKKFQKPQSHFRPKPVKQSSPHFFFFPAWPNSFPLFFQAGPHSPLFSCGPVCLPFPFHATRLACSHHARPTCFNPAPPHVSPRPSRPAHSPCQLSCCPPLRKS